MISNILKSCKLINPISRSLVYRTKRPRHLFEKSLAPEDYEINPLPPAKGSKPRRPEWADPNVIWPPVIPAANKLKGKDLLHQIEHEEKEKLMLVKPYTIPDFRSGDVIKFHYLHSLSEGKGNEFTGLCLGVAKRESLHANFWVIVRVSGSPTLFNVKLHSPFLANLEIVQRGSGNHNSKLFSYLKTMKANNKFNMPMIKGEPKARKGEMKIVAKKITTQSVKYDKIDM